MKRAIDVMMFIASLHKYAFHLSRSYKIIQEYEESEFDSSPPDNDELNPDFPP